MQGKLEFASTGLFGTIMIGFTDLLNNLNYFQF